MLFFTTFRRGLMFSIPMPEKNEELELQTGQKAILLGLPAIIGSKARQCLFNTLQHWLQLRHCDGNTQDAYGTNAALAAVAAPTTAVTLAPTSTARKEEGVLKVQPKPQVILLGLPAMVCKHGTIIGLALENAFFSTLGQWPQLQHVDRQHPSFASLLQPLLLAMLAKLCV